MNTLLLDDQAIVITVRGEPAGQGRISFLGKGRTKHSNEKQLLPWRAAIIGAACEVTGRHAYTGDKNDKALCTACGIARGQHAILVGVPVAADITVTVEKPKGALKTRRTWPITRSSTDIDHHARACLDALSQSGVIYRDDSQVVDLRIRKVYPGEHTRALPEPGVVIRIREVKW